MDVGQTLGVGVAGHHDVRLFGQQGLERVEKLFLGTVLVGKELHIVDQEQIEGVVALLELVKSLALIGFNHIRNELFRVDVENFGVRSIRQQPVAHGMDQMGLAQTDPAVDEQGVVQLPRGACHVHRRGARHPVGRTLDQGVKRQRRIEPRLEDRCIGVLGRVGRLGGRHPLGCYRARVSAGGLFAVSEHQLQLYGLAINLLEQGGNPPGVLGAYPVELEPIGHEQSDPC